MDRPKISLLVILLFGCLEPLLAKEFDCSRTPWERMTKLTDDGCSDYPTIPLQLYKDVLPNNQTRSICCALDNPTLDEKRKNGLKCTMSPCLTTPKNNCPTRYFNDGKVVRFEEILREKCTEDGKPGYTGLCCPENSLEGKLASAYGAEPNEFPHMVKLKLPENCGGTIYNDQFIITAAHCVINNENTIDPASRMKVIIGSNSGSSTDESYLYEVDEVIPHPVYSRLESNPNFEKMKKYILNDIALLKLKKKIKFGPNVKALKIAEKDFNPRAFTDQAVIVGWGTTDTLDTSVHLQKTNVLFRDPPNCFSGQGPHWEYEEYQSQLLCVGGILEGKWSPTAGRGDSGGPAVCRDANGNAVLCGVTSFGGNATDGDCVKYNDEINCQPSVYARVSEFHDWIKENAGKPAHDDYIYKPYLYGEPTTTKRYDHQVHVTSKTGKSCGGTLISQDVVITAASCVAKNDGTGHSGIQVHYGLDDLGKNMTAKTYDMVRIATFKGFKMVGDNINITSQGKRVLITDNYYNNNLAAIKINGKAPISPSKLPQLPESGDVFVNGTEIAFPRKRNHGGKLLLRDFHILDKEECQKRMKRLANGDGKMGGGNTKVSGDILCGVEKYSGGSLCDRELGGGLICEGKNGKDVLCGVQIFRLCEWSLPNAFMDMSQKKKWVELVLKSFG